jgi:hypothetical protein
MHDIFISYSSKHRDLTRTLAAAIEAHYGAGSVWWDHALESWGDYEIQIRNALNEARAVAVIWTKEAGESDWVKSEAGRASRDGKLVNVRPPGLAWRDVPSPYDQHHFNDLNDAGGILRTIASVLTGTLPRTAVPLHEIYERHHGQRLIDPRQSRLARDPSDILPTDLLQASYAVVPYTDVTGAKADLLAWCRDDARTTAGRLVHGPGGLGKTRLLIEVAAELQEAGWMAGFLDPPYTDNVASERWQALDQLIAHGDGNGLLVVMDYAEGRQKELKELAERLVRRPDGDTRPVRLVLLTRTAGEWWTTLRDKTAEIQRLFRRDAHGPGVIALPAIATAEQRRALFFASAEAMAPTLAAKGYAKPADQPSPGRLAVIEHDADHARPLAVQMEALLRLAAAAPDADAAGVDKLLDGVLGLERDHWDKFLRDDRHRVHDLGDDRERDIRRGVAQVTVVQGTDSRTSTEKLLMADRFYGAQRNERVAAVPILRDLLLLYGKPADTGLRKLEPDLIGEHLVAMTADQELIDGCLAWISEEPPEGREKRHRDLITVLQRATHPDHGDAAANASALLDHLVMTRTRDLAGEIVAVTVDTPGALLGRLEQQLDAFDEETLGSVNSALPVQSLTLMEFSVRIASRLADASLSRHAGSLNTLGIRLFDLGRREEALAASQEAAAIRRRLAEARPDAFLPDLAQSLSGLGLRLSSLGRHEEALAAHQEAVAIRRRLAGPRPDAFLHDRAASLSNLGMGLSNLGRREEAVAALQEAVAIWRPLAQDRPETSLPLLASGLNNLSVYLSHLGRREEALAAIQEALAIYRRLAETRSDAFLADLAMSLNNLGLRLSHLGRREEALAASREAVAIRRGIIETRPDTFMPDLAASLNNLSMDLSALGRHEEALAAAQEALTIRRGLAETRPDAFLPDLATSLNNIAGYLSALGRRDEALASAQEAVATYRRLAETRPEAFLPYLAGCLSNFSADLSGLGRHEQALAASQEAVAISRRLAETSPEAFLPYLAGSLNNLSTELSHLGRSEEALAASQEAVAISRRLAETSPEAFLRDLAGRLDNLGTRLSNLGRREEALASVQEAVAIIRRLAEAHPDAFLPDLAMSLNNLGAHLSNLGRSEEALTASQEAVALFRRFAETRPDAFLPSLAESLGARGQALAQAQRYSDAADAFGEGLTIVAPLVEQHAQAFRGLARTLREGYLAACDNAGISPGAGLAERVAQALKGADT